MSRTKSHLSRANKVTCLEPKVTFVIPKVQLRSAECPTSHHRARDSHFGSNLRPANRTDPLPTIRFRYDPTLVELIKTAVPAPARSWNPTAKEWTVAAGHAERLAQALRATGHRVIGLEDPRPQADTRIPDTALWARILFRRVGPTRHEPVFRALTRVLHPDTPTGDGVIQRELNLARDELTDGDR